MVRRLFTLVLVLGLIAVPSAFAAGTLRCPVGETPQIGLAYGASYVEGDSSHVHRGVDLAADAGTSIRASGNGTVTFAGSVPSVGTSQTTRAVTVQQADGLKVTYMPLASLSVAAGKEVEAGDPLGTLAGEGDVSSSAPHLHLSVRNGSAYLDPGPMLVSVAAPIQQSEPEPSAAPKTASSAKPATAPSPAPATAPVASASAVRVPVSAPQATMQQSPVTAAKPVAATQAVASSAPVLRTHSAGGTTRASAWKPATGARVTPASAYGALQKLALWIAELMVAVAFLVPVIRRMSRPAETAEPAAEPASVRVRA